jgi:hypothetical protein
MAVPIRVSLDAKLYYGAAGSTASTLLNTVGDVTLSLKKSETKISSRATRWALFKGALKEAEVSFELIDDPNEGAVAALVGAFMSDEPMAFCVRDALNGAGLDADFEILGADRDEKLEDAIKYKFTIKPTYVSRYPSWSPGGVAGGGGPEGENPA